MKTTSLGERLVLYFVLLGLSVILAISAVAFYSTKKALVARTSDQLISLRIVKKNQVEQFFSDRARDITFLVNQVSPYVQDTGDSHSLRTMLRILGQYYTGFFIVSDNRTLFAGNLEDEVKAVPALFNDLYRDLRSQVGAGNPIWVSDVLRDPVTGKPRQFIAGRIPARQGENTRMLVLELAPGALDGIMLNNDPGSGLGLTGETYLVGADRLMRSTSRFRTGTILSTPVQTIPVSEALSGRSGAMTARDYRDIPVLSSYAPLRVQGLTWAVLSEIDLKEAMVPVYSIRSRILLLSLVLMVLFFIIVLLIARGITRPIVRLKDAAIHLGEGRYNIELPVGTLDEIGSLTGAFNVMARQIREKTTELQQERSGRMQSVFDGEEMERQRLSRELHDGIGQSLIAVKLRLESLLYQQEGDIRTSIQELKRFFDQIIDEVRRISNNLMPSVLEAFSIPIAFRNLFTETEEHSSLKIHFEARGSFDDLDRKTKTYLYRLMQEALNNIVKHAAAREVWVQLTRAPDQLSLVIRDDGRGFRPDQAGKEGGNGIHNMRERAGLLRGSLDIVSGNGQGTIITLNIPNPLADVKNQDFPRG
ncbi:MAG TPA: histidine kinase [Bacteroidales bacterium]|nr:histidine kinase [Bacteroidales bacterium]HPS61609.1 histidine kinase [Bacteroidales bacterium]